MAESSEERTILVCGIRPDFDNDTLELLFESKGGPVTEVQRPEKSTSAHVTFEVASGNLLSSMMKVCLYFFVMRC